MGEYFDKDEPFAVHTLGYRPGRIAVFFAVLRRKECECGIPVVMWSPATRDRNVFFLPSSFPYPLSCRLQKMAKYFTSTELCDDGDDVVAPPLAGVQRVIGDTSSLFLALTLTHTHTDYRARRWRTSRDDGSHTARTPPPPPQHSSYLKIVDD